MQKFLHCQPNKVNFTKNLHFGFGNTANHFRLMGSTLRNKSKWDTSWKVFTITDLLHNWWLEHKVSHCKLRLDCQIHLLCTLDGTAWFTGYIHRANGFIMVIELIRMLLGPNSYVCNFKPKLHSVISITTLWHLFWNHKIQLLITSIFSCHVLVKLPYWLEKDAI